MEAENRMKRKRKQRNTLNRRSRKREERKMESGKVTSEGRVKREVNITKTIKFKISLTQIFLYQEYVKF